MEKQDHKKKATWRSEEDDKLRHYVNIHGAHHWDTMAHDLDIGRSGNSCRLRWVNYLSPSVRRGNITDEEMLLILKLHSELGNQWSKIALEFPGRRDNDIKNFWNTRVKKEAKQLNCDVESEEFQHIMMTKLKDKVQSAAVPPPTTIAGGGIAATLVDSSTDDPPSFITWL
ncbi:hypothetical protein ACS0TY_029861 [Phlomoides rotata]